MQTESPHARPIRVVEKAARIAELRLRNRVSRTPVTGSAPAVVSLTSYGKRLDVVGHTVESIAAGSIRPQRMILWVDDPDFTVAHFPMLKRLVARGLEIGRCENFLPHTKYYPTLEANGPLTVPLVTADDDILYPKRWLEGLLAEGEKRPGTMLGYRAHWVAVDPEQGIQPYHLWPAAPTEVSSPNVFLTGVAGVLYPVTLQRALHNRGRDFLDVAPRADDIWINAVAVDEGVPKVAIASAFVSHALTYPGTQSDGLHESNVNTGENDVQMEATHKHLNLPHSAYMPTGDRPQSIN